MNGGWGSLDIMLFTANSSSKKPEMKKAAAVKQPPVAILWSGFFKMLNLQKLFALKLSKY